MERDKWRSLSEPLWSLKDLQVRERHLRAKREISSEQELIMR